MKFRLSKFNSAMGEMHINPHLVRNIYPMGDDQTVVVFDDAHSVVVFMPVDRVASELFRPE